MRDMYRPLANSYSCSFRQLSVDHRLIQSQTLVGGTSMIRLFVLLVLLNVAFALSLERVGISKAKYRSNEEIETSDTPPPVEPSPISGSSPGINVSHAEAEQNEQRKPSSLSLIPDRGTFQEDVCSECSQRLVQMTKFCLPYGFKINIMNTPATKVKYLIDIDSYEADSDDPSSCLNSSLVEADHKSCKVHLMQIVFSKKMKQKEAKCTCPNLATKRELEKSDIRLYIASDWRSELYDDDSGHKGRRGNRSQISLAKELNRLVRKILTLLCPKPSKPIYTKLHNFRERIPKETITN